MWKKLSPQPPFCLVEKMGADMTRDDMEVTTIQFDNFQVIKLVPGRLLEVCWTTRLVWTE